MGQTKVDPGEYARAIVYRCWARELSKTDVERARHGGQLRFVDERELLFATRGILVLTTMVIAASAGIVWFLTR